MAEAGHFWRGKGSAPAGGESYPRHERILRVVCGSSMFDGSVGLNGYTYGHKESDLQNKKKT